MNKERIAIVQMLGCATLWSLAGIFFKLIPWNGVALAGIRSLIAGITFIVYMRFAGIPYVLNKKTFISGVLTACTYICFVCANKLTTAANAIVLQFTAPVFIVMYTSLVMKKPLRKPDLLVVLFTLLGIALFFIDQLQPGYVLGNIVAIVAGVFMAGIFISVGELEGEQRYSGVLNGQIITFIIGLPFALVTKPEFSLVPILAILVLGVFQLGTAYILYVKSSAHCPPLACCLLSAVEPLLNPIWVLIFDGERPGIFAFVGGIIVIVSITVWCIFGKEKAPEETLVEV